MGTTHSGTSEDGERSHGTDARCRFAKFFGSGVIIATAFIHLLAPAWGELTSPCLTGTWTEYVSRGGATQMVWAWGVGWCCGTGMTR
jgi:hypothetical protein